MEFGWTETQQAYRGELRQFLRDTLPGDWEEVRRHGVAAPAQIDYSRIFCAKMAAAGLLVRHWPEEFGGGGGNAWEHFILGEEMLSVGEPRGPQYMNVNWLGPVLMKYGTEQQKAEYLTGIASGTVIWCQGYSEPNAGTDLAGLQTRAVRDGDDYVVNGSKIWTSYSYMADLCFLLARTGTERKDISIFIVPMDTPGITVTPVPGLTEYGHLNEVFFSDVRVPASARVGEEGKAWDIISYALSFERVGIPRYEYGRKMLDLAVAQLKQEGRFDGPIIRAAAGHIVAKLECARLLAYRVVDLRAKNAPPSVDANVARVAGAQAIIDLCNFLIEHLPDCLTGGNHDLEVFYRSQLSTPIAAGTQEIQLNLIAQRALDLPRGK